MDITPQPAIQNQTQSVPETAPGQILENKARGRGYGDDDVEAWKSQMTETLQKRNFSDQEIKDFWGVKTPDLSNAQNQVQANMQAARTDSSGQQKDQYNPVKPVEEKDVWQAMKDGWGEGFGMSLIGLKARGGMPDKQVSDDAGIVENLSATVGQLAGDLPASLGGMGVGAMVAGPFGAAAGAFAVPRALRKHLIDGYQKGSVKDTGDFARRIVGMTFEAAKGAVEGEATVLTGGFAGAIAGGMAKKFVGSVGGAIAGTAAKAVAESAALTTVSSALEARLPKYRDFLNGAVAIGGLHALGYGMGKVGYVTDKMRNIYAETGAHPAEIAEAANNNPKLKGELLSANPDLPIEASPLNASNTIELKAGESVLGKGEAAQPPPPEEPPTKTPEGGSGGPPSVEAAGNEILSRIGDDSKPTKSMIEKGKDAWDALFKWWNDQTDYTKAVLKVQEEQGIAEEPAEKNAHKQMNLFPAHIDKVQMAFHYGTLDFATKEVNGEAFFDIKNDYEKEFPDDPKRLELKKYEVARQSLDLDQRGIKQPGNRENDKIFVEANKDKYQPYLDRKVAWENRILKYGQDAGLISQKQYDAITTKNPNHTPLQKIQDIDELTGKRGGGTKVLKRIFGNTDLKIIDPDVSRMKNADMMIRLAEENNTKKLFYNNQMELDEDARAIRKVNPDMKPIKISSEELHDQLAKQGYDIDPDSITAFRPRDAFLTKSQSDFYDNGKRVVFEGMPEVIDAINRLKGDQTATNAFLNFILKPFTVGLRAGTVNNPTFGARHTGKNQFVGATYSKTGFVPGQGWERLGEFVTDKLNDGTIDKISDITSMTQLLMRHDPEFQKFVANGGAVNAVLPLDEGYLDSEIFKLNPTPAAKFWNAVTTTGALTHHMITLGDNLIRYEEFKALKTQTPNMSDQEAAYQARQVLPDYQKAALQKSALRVYKAFLGIHMISLERMGTELSDPDARAGYILKNLTWITLPSILLKMANNGDDKIDDVSDHHKIVSWVTQIDNWREANSDAEYHSEKDAYPSSVREQNGKLMVNDGTMIRLPKPFAPGIAFGSGAEAIMESWKKKDPKAFGRYLSEIAGQIIVSPLPDAPTPVLEHAMNKNFWTGMPIVKQSMEGKLPWEQSDQFTSETAKLIGKALSYVPLVRDIGPNGPNGAHLSSPMVIDNYLHSFGTLGNYIIDASDQALRAAHIAPPDPGKVTDLSRKPFIREFTIAVPGADPQSVQDFLERNRYADEIKNTLKDLRKKGEMSGNMSEFEKARERYQDEAPRLDNRQKQILNAHKAITNIDADPNMPQNEKRQAEQLLFYNMVAWAKQGNKFFDDFKNRSK